ncbi:MAG TPA: T9SS type A sorting domain-containing protein [Bacteroidia bacterium]|nr:T9SS type A sorting domain-containing protein [Bacteroidia bacterium]
MKSKHFIFSFISLCIATTANAQHENDRWVFGGAPFPTNPPALNFFSGVPVSVPTVPVSGLWATESAAAVADRITGALLFYTDASNVFTANQSLMPEGGATFTTKLSGCNSTTQGVLILPRPGVAGHFYIFTLDCTEDFTSSTYSGLRFSEVDMSLNGGLGDVIAATRNTLMWGPPANNKLTEKLTATRHTNGNDYWVVVHEWTTNNFLSFAITCSGVSLNPVISSTGTIHTGGSSFPNEIIGAMKISPNRSRLALVAQDALNLIEIFNFNPTTGVVSNPITLPGNGGLDYGLEFSPNSQRLYVTVYNPFPCCSGTIFQYNLAAGTAAAIQASKFQVANSSSVGYGGMQLGPDNKIHVSRVLQTNNLGIINSPDNLNGACGFSNTGAPLSSRRSNIGLINMVPFQTNPVCLPLPIQLLYFNATTEDNEKVLLKWATASELNNNYFKIEKSVDGKTFSQIGIIKGNGTSSAMHEYLFIDNVSKVLVYYRLSQIDFNGDMQTFPVIALKPKAGSEPVITINSNNDLVNVFFPHNFKSEHVKIFLFDSYGKKICQKIISSSENENQTVEMKLPVNLEKGIYFIKAEHGNSDYIHKFIIM